MKKWQGSKWIRPECRARIYSRDKFKCTHCGCRVASQSDPDRKRLHRALATLDHVIPRSRGGTNADGNLQTSCKACNSSRGNKVHKNHRPYSVGMLYHPGHGVETLVEFEIRPEPGTGILGYVTKVLDTRQVFHGYS